MSSATAGADRRTSLGLAFALGGFFLISTTDTLVRVMAQSYDPVQISWARYVFTFLPLLALGRGFRPRSLIEAPRLGLQLLRSALLLVSTFSLFFALKFMSLPEANAIGFVAPLLTTALAVVILHERIDPRRWIAIGIGFAGVLVVIRPGFGGMSWHALLPLALAVSFALYQVLTRLLRETDPLASLFYSAIFGAVVTSAMVPFFWTAPDALGWLGLAVVGIGIGSGHLCLIHALRHAPASIVSPMAYSQIIWAVLMGLAIFGTLPGLWTVIGGAIVIGSGLYLVAAGMRGR